MRLIIQPKEMTLTKLKEMFHILHLLCCILISMLRYLNVMIENMLIYINQSSKYSKVPNKRGGSNKQGG